MKGVLSMPFLWLAFARYHRGHYGYAEIHDQ